VPTRVNAPHGVAIRLEVFAGRIRVTNTQTQTDRQTTLRVPFIGFQIKYDDDDGDICRNRPHLCYACDACSSFYLSYIFMFPSVFWRY